ncbi:MAG TPA: hypothetical protein VEA80_14125 [Vitreimonas sp.]|uniref:hypothetical protein n=1 Tax=Vitreimonas sp. TaxID=3069702 RepID=UPI002D6BBD2D|nr:hypothetical protein [Vitreimonas sp.]HYD88607.1 hypothetical protein [Vitreimonas sp.]
MSLNKRDVLRALAALTAGAAFPATAQTAAPDLSAGRAIGAAYRAANPAVDFTALRRELLPRGFSSDAAAQLRQRVAADFRAARVFMFKGWRLSETEARLFALLT